MISPPPPRARSSSSRRSPLRRLGWACAAALLVFAVGCGSLRKEERRAAQEVSREVRDVSRKASRAVYRAETHSGEIIWRVQTDQKVVALTLDDGPDPKYTPRVLDLARRRHVKFTFFLVGREIDDHADLAKREAAEGHAIGNHTWDHPNLTYDDERQNLAEIERCEDEIQRICGVRTHLLRPPKGLWDGDTFVAAEALGYRMILWSLTLEHHSAPTPEAMAKRVLDRVTPGMIILAHDGEPCHRVNREKTVQALPLLVDGLLKRGYRLVTIPELLKIGEKQK